MKKYTTDKLRNVGFFGHGGSGKTTMSEAILFNLKVVDRFGKVMEGTTTSDFDPDEIKRQISIYSSTVPVEYANCKINFIDTPGFLDFAAQVQSALRVVETGVFFVSGQAGVEVGLERVWSLAENEKIGRIFFINKLDKENTDFEKALASITNVLRIDGAVVPMQLPIGVAEKFHGIVDLVDMVAWTYDANGKATKGDIPADMKAKAEEYREKLVESAAGTDESLMEKFFEGQLSDEDVKKGIAQGIKTGALMPVLCGAAEKSIGVNLLLDAVIKYCPSPDMMGTIEAFKPKSDEKVEVKVDSSEPVSLMIFKTTTDPYVGRLSVMRVFSGTLKPDTTLYNPNKDIDEKVSALMIFRGKNHETVDEVYAGDIVTVAKLNVTGTGDTLCTKEKPVQFPPIEFPDPLMSLAVYPKSKGDEDKLSSGLTKLVEEDPTFKVFRDPVTKETVISGIGDLQLTILMERLKRKFGIDVELTTPKVPYRETIKGTAESDYKHKKQSGGRGQYGHAVIDIEPMPRDGGYEFVDKIVGGVVPKNYIPAVDKGVRKAMEEGVLAGYPVVDIRVKLKFGSYHTVDSSDMAFQIAGSMAFKKGVINAKPILLEPVYEVEVVVPEQFMGDVIGDLNSRRGRILGMDPIGGGQQKIKALVPQAEIMKYSIDLRSITQGRGVFNMKFATYEEVPAPIAEPIIASAKKAADEE